VTETGNGCTQLAKGYLSAKLGTRDPVEFNSSRKPNTGSFGCVGPESSGIQSKEVPLRVTETYLHGKPRDRSCACLIAYFPFKFKFQFTSH
jgi:hypothetical protein